MMLLTADSHRAGLWIRTIWLCGFRPAETDTFMGSHINYDAGLVFIDGTKTESAKSRLVPVPADLLNDFRLRNLHPEKPVFRNAHGYRMRKSSRAKLWESFKREMNIRAGCKVYRNQLTETVIADQSCAVLFQALFCY